MTNTSESQLKFQGVKYVIEKGIHCSLDYLVPEKSSSLRDELVHRKLNASTFS